MSSMVVKEWKLQDILVIDNERGLVTLTFFNSKMHGVPGWTQMVELTTEQVHELCMHLRTHAERAKEKKL